MSDYLEIYDRDMRFLGILEDAVDISYTLQHNELSTASFALPSGSEGNALCTALRIVKIFDGDETIGLFRIATAPSSDQRQGGYTTYNCDHVIATLADDVLIGAHTIGGEGIRTADVLRYILDRQATRRWTLGECDFADEYAYNFENNTLLDALFSLGGVLLDEYRWEYDTSTQPWRLSLKRAPAAATCGLIYEHNLDGIDKSMDASKLCTRLCPLGYGEGDNQLTIKSVNGGSAYIDADTQKTWGVITSVYPDTRQTDAATLMARAQAILERVKNPLISYTASAVDLSRITGDAWDRAHTGDLVRVLDNEHGIAFEARVVTISKPDVRGAPWELKITIANSAEDQADEINDLIDKQGIHELYSQGATNLYSQQFADNADPTHPARMRFYVPGNVVRINQILIKWDTEKFRAYETGADYAGAEVITSEDGGGGARTSEYGGGVSVSTPQTVITTDGATSAPLVDGEISVSTAMVVGQRTRTTNAQTGNPIDENGTAATATGAGGTARTDATNAQTGNPVNASGAAMAATDAGGTARTDATNAQTGNPSTVSSGGSSPGTDESGGHTHTVNGHTHSFGGSDSAGIGHNHSLSSGASNTGAISSGIKTVSISISGTSGSSSPGTNTRGAHSHTVNNHAHDITHTHFANHSHTIATHSHGMTHAHFANHSHTIAAHTHGMVHMHNVNHSHEIPDHQHEFNHTHTASVRVTIPPMEIKIGAHRHTVNLPEHQHTVPVPSHRHAIVYGIYEGSSAQKMTVLVDGAELPAADVEDADELDITRYLKADKEGRVLRGAWHEVRFVPDTLSRIVANLHLQVFIQSRGGGDF